MKKCLGVAMIGLLMFVCPALAHHPAASIVDEEIYSVIDEMVSDTPHADMVFDDMDEDVTMTTISGSLKSIEGLIDDGLLNEVAELDGYVTLTIEFVDRRNVVITISQSE